MSDRYEFMPGLFLNVALASNFFIVQVQGKFPSHVPMFPVLYWEIVLNLH